MDAPRLIPPAGGELIGDAPDRRVEILCEHDGLHATWSRFGPGRAGADLHVHREHTDAFYVLAGELTLRLGAADDPVRLRAGALAVLPPGVVHGFRNGSGEHEVRYLNLHAPGRGFAAYLRGLRDGRRIAFDQHDPPRDGARPATDAAIGGAEPLAAGALHADLPELAVAELHGRDEPAHVHDRHLECLYVLDGAVVLRADGGALRAEAGSWLTVPPGAPHALSAADARVLCLRAPGCGWGARLRGWERGSFDERPA